MVFAIATKNSVRLYDTQQQMPFADISNIHYARLTDLTWSSDGTALIVSSFDGFCTLIMFKEGELGKVYEKPIDEPMDVSTAEDDAKENVNANEAPRKPSPIETRKKPRDLSSPDQKSDAKDNVVVALEIPETIIASVETFESPEYKGTPATPIAIRREPRTNPSTPTTQNATAPESVSTKKATPIAVKRKPRNILASSATEIVNRTTVEHEEALDAWPIPIDNSIKQAPTIESMKKIESSATDVDKTEDMRLIYEGDSESNLPKSMSAQCALETPAAPEANNPKTPRRVQLRTISTPKSKKKLL